MLHERFKEVLEKTSLRNAIEKGCDSVVSRFEYDKNRILAVKRYINSIPRMTYRQLSLYMKVANKASLFITKLPLGDDRSIQVLVNPILDLDYDPRYDCWVTFSPWVDEPNLVEIKDSNTDIPAWLAELKEVASLCSSPHLYFTGLLTEWSKYLNNHLGTKGIGLCPVNIKAGREKMIITDLCGSVNRLKMCL